MNYYISQLTEAHFVIIQNIGFILSALAFLLKDMLYLRSVFVVSYLFVLFYSTYAYDEVKYTVLAWTLFFISINIIYIAILTRERMNKKLNTKENIVFNRKFKLLPQHKFKKLMDMGEWIAIVDSYEKIIQEKENVKYLVYIYSGQAHITKNGEPIVSLNNNTFLGEMSLMTGDKASATVTVDNGTVLLRWDIEKLNKELVKDEELNNLLLAVFGCDMAFKLKTKF